MMGAKNPILIIKAPILHVLECPVDRFYIAARAPQTHTKVLTWTQLLMVRAICGHGLVTEPFLRSHVCVQPLGQHAENSSPSEITEISTATIIIHLKQHEAPKKTSLNPEHLKLCSGCQSTKKLCFLNEGI